MKYQTNLDKTICFCNMISIGEAIEIIKENNINSIDEFIEKDLDIGNKCEACLEENDFNLKDLIEELHK